jgi:5-formyltetrahydrofolate cyclo-ligase
MMKQAIRNNFLNLRNNLAVSERIAMSKIICDKILDGEQCGGYVPFGSEVDVASVPFYCLPKIIDGEMFFCKNGELEKNTRYGFMQPVNSDIIVPKKIYIPLVAFDSKGFRLGYGGGFYDKYLAENPSVEKIGVAFSMQYTDSLPIENHDVQLDSVLTEYAYMHS